MTHDLQTRNPLLQEVEAKGLSDLARYRRFVSIDIREGQRGKIAFWRRLARSAVADIRHARTTQAEIA